MAFAVGILGLVLSQGKVQAQIGKKGSIDLKGTATSVDPRRPLPGLTLSNKQLESLVWERQESVASLKKEVAALRVAYHKSFKNYLDAFKIVPPSDWAPKNLMDQIKLRQAQAQAGNKGSIDLKGTATSFDPRAARLPFPGLTLSTKQLDALVWDLQASVASLNKELTVLQGEYNIIFNILADLDRKGGGKGPGATKIVEATKIVLDLIRRLKEERRQTGNKLSVRIPLPGQRPTRSNQQMESAIWEVQASVASLKNEVALHRVTLSRFDVLVENWKWAWKNVVLRGN